MLSVQSLSKSYGSNRVLTDISLRFQKGEIHGIVGKNGAGKTTLFQCMTGLESFEGEVVYADGVLKNCTGYLQTAPYFLPLMTGYEYLRLICSGRGKDHVDIPAYNLFDLPLSRYAEFYSTGMKKKLAITGILLQQNDVFILDEPFNGVDIMSVVVIKDIVRRLKKAGKIVVLSSHILSTLEDTCDHLHYVEAGRLVKSLAKGQFHEIAGAFIVDEKSKGILDSLL